MAVKMLCFSFLVVVVAINQSLAVPNQLDLYSRRDFSNLYAGRSDTHSRAGRDSKYFTYTDDEDQVLWDIEFENDRSEYRIKKGASITWILLLKNAKDEYNLACGVLRPNDEPIDPDILAVKYEQFPDLLLKKVHITLKNMYIGGNYTVFAYDYQENVKVLVSHVTITNGTSSSGVRRESTFFAIVVALYACRSVTFGTTLQIS